MATRILSTVIASVIGALASLLVERAWKRHKEKQKQNQDQT